VLLTHRAIVAAIAACQAYLHNYDEEIKEGDCYFSFLPLAHVFDRCVSVSVCVYVYLGGCG
jgi:long-chain acyl-CoA synthetase